MLLPDLNTDNRSRAEATCRKKQRHNNATRACNALKWMRQRLGRDKCKYLHVFQCSVCRKWHIGTVPPEHRAVVDEYLAAKDAARAVRRDRAVEDEMYQAAIRAWENEGGSVRKHR